MEIQKHIPDIRPVATTTKVTSLMHFLECMNGIDTMITQWKYTVKCLAEIGRYMQQSCMKTECVRNTCTLGSKINDHLLQNCWCVDDREYFGTRGHSWGNGGLRKGY